MTQPRLFKGPRSRRPSSSKHRQRVTLFWKSSSVHNFSESAELGCNYSRMFGAKKPPASKATEKTKRRGVKSLCNSQRALRLGHQEVGSDKPSLEAGGGGGGAGGRHTVPIICNLACGLPASSAQTRAVYSTRQLCRSRWSNPREATDAHMEI